MSPQQDNAMLATFSNQNQTKPLYIINEENNIQQQMRGLPIATGGDTQLLPVIQDNNGPSMLNMEGYSKNLLS